jgi:cobyrinic acid a,c-diamide synthase
MTGAGKTTITLGLLAALRNRGVRVQPFKVGPDFIDPGLHRLAAGRGSHNLDGWMLPREANEWLFATACANADAAIVEGMMGLFDGFDGSSEAGSTAEMARWLGLKVVLIIDAGGLGRSIAAIARGIRDYDPRIEIGGIILNRVGGQGHYEILVDALAGFPVLGWLPSEPAIEIPERHLGLMTAAEEIPPMRIRSIAEFVERCIDIPRFIEALPEIEPPQTSTTTVGAVSDRPIEQRMRPHPVRVALAHDQAFSFYYDANRLELERAGAEIVQFSPLWDAALPEADFLYIGGGYPELYKEALSSNASMLHSVREYIQSGKRFYAECGGLMYLSQAIDEAPMVGAIPTRIEMTGRLVDFGYCDVSTEHDSILGPAGLEARGHQFHYSRSTDESAAPLYCVRQRTRRYREGFRLLNGVASYVHLHFLSNRRLAENLLG